MGSLGIDWKPPGGESKRKVIKRALNGFKKLLKKHKGQQILAVTHASIIKAIVHCIRGRKPETYFDYDNPFETGDAVRIICDGKKFAITKLRL